MTVVCICVLLRSSSIVTNRNCHEKGHHPNSCSDRILPDLPLVVFNQRNKYGYHLVRCRIRHTSHCNLPADPKHRQSRLLQNVVVNFRRCDTEATLGFHRKFPVMHGCMLGIIGPPSGVTFRHLRSTLFQSSRLYSGCGILCPQINHERVKTMKALKIFRIAALAATLLCLVLSLIYNFIDDGRNWYVILFLGFFLISLPAGLIVRMKNEDNPVHNILLVLFLGVCMVLFLDSTMTNQKGFYFILGAFFLSLYQICRQQKKSATSLKATVSRQ